MRRDPWDRRSRHGITSLANGLVLVARDLRVAGRVCGPAHASTLERLDATLVRSWTKAGVDPKPGRPTGGSFAAIESSLTGVRVSEHLPRLAARMHQLTLIRSLTAKEGNHERARYLMHTGFSPQGGVVHPGLGSHMARAGGEGGELPRYVSINSPGQGAGYLGASHSAFSVLDADRDPAGARRSSTRSCSSRSVHRIRLATAQAALRRAA